MADTKTKPAPVAPSDYQMAVDALNEAHAALTEGRAKLAQAGELARTGGADKIFLRNLRNLTDSVEAPLVKLRQFEKQIKSLGKIK